jgi:hypothetical protein
MKNKKLVYGTNYDYKKGTKVYHQWNKPQLEIMTSPGTKF